MAHQPVELEDRFRTEFETSMPGRPVLSGCLRRAFASMIYDVDLAAIEIYKDFDDTTGKCLFAPPDQLVEQLRQAADTVEAFSQ